MTDPNWRELSFPGFPPRVNHASVCDNGNYTIYSSGGFYVNRKAALEHNPLVETVVDIYRLRLRDLSPKWERIYPNSPKPVCDRHTIPRHGHAMFIHNGKLIFIGGNANNRSTHILPSMLSVFSLTTGSFETDIKQKGHIPLERDTHACCQVGDIVYMHGGIERSSKSTLFNFSNELYSLDLSTNRWTLFPSMGCAGEVRLMFHSLNFHSDKLYAFGGENSPNSFSTHHSNKTYTYNLQEGKWSELVTQGTPPAPRRSHITLNFKGRLLVFGGACSEVAAFYNDLFFLNLDTNAWTEFVPSGKRPVARRRCGCCLVDNSVYIFGGITPHPDTIAGNTISTVFYNPLCENMIDLSDTHVLSFDPTLKSLCLQAVCRFSLDESYLHQMLPLTLFKDLIMFRENRTVDKQNENIIASYTDF